MESGQFKLKQVKRFVFVLSLFPLFWFGWMAFTDQLGANPIEKTLHHMGDWGLNFLFITLSITPLQKLTGMNWLVGLRRMMGLYTFFYVSLHFMTYVAIDQFFSWNAIVEDVIKHKRIVAGFIAFLLLIPLAVTSSDSMIKRLGGVRWKKLHRLVYPAAICAVIHYLLLVKLDMRIPFIYAFILIVLFLLRRVKKEGQGSGGRKNSKQ